jgi:hypothetical protein
MGHQAANLVEEGSLVEEGFRRRRIVKPLSSS